MGRNLPCNLPEADRERVFGYFEDHPWLDEAAEAQMSACFSQYLFYETWGTRNYRDCHCTHCGGYSLYADDMPTFFKKKHGDDITCPQCGGDVAMVALGKMKNLSTLNNEERRFSIFRPAPDGGLLVISGWGTKYYTWGDLSPVVGFREKERQYFAPGVRMRWKRTWTYGGPCGTGTAHPVGWEPCDSMAEPFNPSINRTSDGSYYLICPERIGDTALRYCQLEDWYHDRCKVWLTDTGDSVRYIHKFLAAYTAYPYIEMGCKLGFYTAVDELVLENKKNAQLLNWNAPTSWGFLRLNRRDGRAFLRAEGSLDLLKAYRQAQKEGGAPSLQTFLELAAKVGGEKNAGLLYRTARKAGCTITEAINYVDRHKDLGRAGTVIQMWSDYLYFAAALDYDLSRRDVALPKDLQERHDAAAETSKILGKQLTDKRYAKRTESLRKMYEFEYGGYCIVVPASAEAIVQEGRALQHCVGGYAARHMKGDIDILFLRKARRKGVSFITMELRRRKSAADPVSIAQIHGYQNDYYGRGEYGHPKEQFAWFLEVWTDWLAHGSKRDSSGKPILPKRKEHSA